MRTNLRNQVIALILACLSWARPGLAQESSGATTSAGENYLSPCSLAATSDGRTLFIAYATANQVAVFDTTLGKVIRSFNVPESPTGLALSPDGRRLYVACAAPQSVVCVVDVAKLKTVGTISVGHNAWAPVVSPDGKRLYVCNRFNNSVSVIDLATREEVALVPVIREPVAAAITPDGRFLFVANHIHNGRADVDYVSATVSIVDTALNQVVKQLTLPNGSSLLRGVCVSPDGRYVCVTHILARFHLPTTQLERGWMNSNAMSLIDVARLDLLNTVLLDNVDSGAANPWAVNWSPDGKTICVTHAGTHEVSVIDAPALLDKLGKIPATADTNAPASYSSGARTASDVPNDLAFMVGLRQRVKLSEQGPRALALIGTKLYVANYFSENLSLIDLEAARLTSSPIALAPAREPSVVRKGEALFNDATICFQGWQSCGSCHSSDGRVDGFNWDLLNDGIGNPKNNKSLLMAHVTPPSMSQGVRESAEAAVRAGIRHSLFTVQPEESSVALDEYLKALKPVPSPWLQEGKFSAAAQRGRKLFLKLEIGCADCHPPHLFSTMKSYEVGTRGQLDSVDGFDTPTLVEVWRTAPYLHDGSAQTVRDVITTHNPDNKHGKTSQLTPAQIDDLVTYVLSL